MSDAVLVAVVHEELERDVAAIGRAEGVGHLGQVPGHHGEQIAGLGVGIFPAGVVLTAGQRTALDAVAVGQQHRKARGVGLQTDGESRQHVRSVEVGRDARKTVRLALRAVHRPGLIEAFERRVGLGLQPGHRGQGELIGHLGDVQRVVVQRPRARRQGLVIDRDRDHL